MASTHTSMRHAILITAYTDFVQLISLVEMFDYRFDIYIHIDKKVKPIALKEAKILSNDEMKLLFGGSGGDSGLTAKCNENAACTVSSGGC